MSTKLNGFKYYNVSLTIQLNISHLFFVLLHSLKDQTIQFSINHLFALRFNIKQFYLTHTNKGVFSIPQSSSIIGASPSDCLVSYLGHLWGGEVLLLC